MLGDTRAGGLNTPRLTRLLVHVEEKEKEIVRQLIKNHLETTLVISFAREYIETNTFGPLHDWRKSAIDAL